MAAGEIMSIEHHVRAVRTALENTAEGAFTVDDVQVAIADGKQTISLTGAHQDGTAIAYKSLPFVGDSAERAKEIARRIMVAHQVRVDTFTDGASLVRATPPVDLKVNTANVSTSPMSMIRKTPLLNGLRGKLDDFMGQVEAAAGALHTKMEADGGNAVTNIGKITGVVAAVSAIAKDIGDAADEALSSTSNGGPPLGNSTPPTEKPVTGL